MIKLPREDGAWWMALMCWVCGWAAARRFNWEVAVVALGIVGLLAAAQALRSGRRLWTADRVAANWSLAMSALLLVPAGAALALVIHRVTDPMWIVLVTLPALLYAPVVLTGTERRPAFRVLAVVALTAIAPATYLVASERADAVAAILWGALGGYFLLGSIFVMARFRRSRAALWVARLAATAAFAGAVVCSSRGGAHWVLSGAFLTLAARAWAHRSTERPADPRKVGQAELVFGAAATLLVLAGIWLR